MGGVYVLSQHQFGRGKDPHSETTKPKFTGAEGSKTMTISGGKVPKPQRRHLHHRKAGRRSHRAK